MTRIDGYLDEQGRFRLLDVPEDSPRPKASDTYHKDCGYLPLPLDTRRSGYTLITTTDGDGGVISQGWREDD